MFKNKHTDLGCHRAWIFNRYDLHIFCWNKKI